MSKKVTENVFNGIMIILFLLLPLEVEIAKPVLYYTVVVVLAVIIIYYTANQDYFDQRFIKKWKKQREQSIITHILRTFVYLVISLFLLQYFVKFIIDPNFDWNVIFQSDLWLIFGFIIVCVTPIFTMIDYNKKEKRFEEMNNYRNRDQ